MATAKKTSDIPGWQTKLTSLTVPIIVGSSKIVPSEVSVTTDQPWQILGGTVTNLTFFRVAMRRIAGRITLQAKVAGTGAQIRVVEMRPDGTETVLTTTNFSVTDTSGDWKPFKFSTDVRPKTGDNAYRVEARRNGATSFDIRFVSMSMLKKKKQ